MSEARKEVVKEIRQFAGRRQLPMGECFKALYRDLGKQEGVNVFAVANLRKVKLLDAVEQMDLMSQALELARNMNYQPEVPPHPAEGDICR